MAALNDSWPERKNKIGHEYTVESVIGRGAYGCVFRACETGKDIESYAIKMIPIDESDKVSIKQIKREIYFQQKHWAGSTIPIIKYYECWEENLSDLPDIVRDELSRLNSYKHADRCICMLMSAEFFFGKNFLC